MSRRVEFTQRDLRRGLGNNTRYIDRKFMSGKQISNLYSSTHDNAGLESGFYNHRTTASFCGVGKTRK